MIEPLICSQCGAPLERGAGKCKYCDTEFAGAEPVFKIDPSTFAWAFPCGLPGGRGGSGSSGLGGGGRVIAYDLDGTPVLEVNE